MAGLMVQTAISVSRIVVV